MPSNLDLSNRTASVSTRTKRLRPNWVKASSTRPRASTSRLVFRRVRIRRESGNGLIAKSKCDSLSWAPPPLFSRPSKLFALPLELIQPLDRAPNQESAV